MARFGFRKIINHYKNSKNNSVKAPEQKFEAQSEQTEQDVSCGEEIDSIAPEVEMESIPSQEQLYVQDVADLQPTAVPQYELDDYTLPSSRKFTREYHRPNLNVTRSRSRRPKAMRHHNAQRRSCAICRQQEIEAGHSSDGCICDRCNSTIRTTFENFMDESQRFQSGQQAEIDNQAEQQPKTNQSQPTHLDKGQQATDYGERRQQSINPNDVPPPFSIVVLQDCENTDQIIEQLTSVLTQILPQQGRNSNNSNNRNAAYSNSCRNILNNYDNACNYNRNYDCNNNSNFDYNNNNNCYESDYANNRPVSPTNTCTCCPSTFYDNDPAGTRKASADWQYICSCDKDVVGSQPHSKHKTKNHKSSSKRKSNSKSKTKISNKTSHNDDCNCSTYGDDDDDDDDDCKDCGACDCDCCKKNPENEMLLKLFVQVMEMFINSTKQREHPKKEKKSKKGKDGQAKDGSKKGKKKEKSEFGDRAGKVKQGKSKGKQNANGNTQINNSNRILPESDKQHARRQNSNRVGAGDATKCGNAAVTCANSGQRPIDVVPVAKGLRPVAHYRPGIVQHPVTYLLANNGECVRRSLVRTAAGATLHERVYSEVFTSSTNPHRKDYSRNAMRCHSTQFSR